MEYLYFLTDASLTLRLVKYLQRMPPLTVEFVTVIHLLQDGWVVKVKMNSTLNPQMSGDFQAFLNELGTPYQPSMNVSMACWSLEAGHSLVDVMLCYEVVVVSHGSPNSGKIEAFCHQFPQELGYCPKTLT